jgi:hypothetical protein
VIYHSALKRFKEWKGEKCYQFQSPDISAYVADIFDGTHDEMRKVDFIYTEPPFPSGYKVFNNRAKPTESRQWSDLMTRMRESLEELDKPAYIMGGYLFDPIFKNWNKQPVLSSIHKGAGTIFYNQTIPDFKPKTTFTLLKALYGIHETGGDIACGYGLVGYMAKKHGKKAVLTDYNPYCIGYIKQESHKW